MTVEVSIRELDESSISFPPVALRANREQDGLMLTSDRDGLTDLAEERLVHDGDGQADGDDPLPQGAHRGTRGGAGKHRRHEAAGVHPRHRRAFRSLATSRRGVVLTRHELELARRKFGPLLPLELPLFVLDHDGRRGYVIWDASWVGGSLALEKSGGSWRVRTVGSWIT